MPKDNYRTALDGLVHAMVQRPYGLDSFDYMRRSLCGVVNTCCCVICKQVITSHTDDEVTCLRCLGMSS